MKWYAAAAVLIMVISGGVRAQQYEFTGTVTTSDGEPIANAIVSLPGAGVSAETDAAGYYELKGQVAAVQTTRPRGSTGDISIRNGEVHLFLPQGGLVSLRMLDVSGRCIKNVPARMVSPGHSSIQFDDRTSSTALRFVEVTTGGTKTLFRHIGFARNATFTKEKSSAAKTAAASLSAELSQQQVLRVSAAGFLSKDTVSSGLTGVYDFQLDTLTRNGTGTAGLDDGSIDRLTYRGTTQYFWGDAGDGTKIPLVKVVTAIGEDAVDIALIFNPGFVDNTYGENTIGWNHHSFMDIVRSDHIELSVTDTEGKVVWAGRIDMITQSTDAPSGYASLGPYGGDGSITTGSEEDVLSFGTSMDDNLNYYGYELFDSSPATDSVYTPNPDYPDWEYYAVYRVSFDPAMFGDSEFGAVEMTSVHASPAKTPQETITVEEGDPPSDSDDPFTHTHFDDPPTDQTDDPEQPPTDTTGEDPEQPPTDSTGDDTEQPPTDSTEG